jgi:hypothetical protein
MQSFAWFPTVWESKIHTLAGNPLQIVKLLDDGVQTEESLCMQQSPTRVEARKSDLCHGYERSTTWSLVMSGAAHPFNALFSLLTGRDDHQSRIVELMPGYQAHCVRCEVYICCVWHASRR